MSETSPATRGVHHVGLTVPDLAATDGVSIAFIQIGRMAQAFHMRIAPHASISAGLCTAASLQAAALQNVPYHE